MFRFAFLLAIPLFAGTAVAQAPRGTWIPPDVKGFRAHQLLLTPGPRATSTSTITAQAPIRVRVAEPTPAPPVQVTITLPPTAQPLEASSAATVAIKGPDGMIRRFPVEGGRQTLESRVIVVHPGERATIRFVINRR